MNVPKFLTVSNMRGTGILGTVIAGYVDIKSDIAVMQNDIEWVKGELASVQGERGSIRSELNTVKNDLKWIRGVLQDDWRADETGRQAPPAPLPVKPNDNA